MNSILRKFFIFYSFIKFFFVSSYSERINNLNINHVVDLNCLKTKKINKKERDLFKILLKINLKIFQKIS